MERRLQLSLIMTKGFSAATFVVLWFGLSAQATPAQVAQAQATPAQAAPVQPGCNAGGLCNGGMVGIAGNYNYNTSTYGAYANRQAAQQINQQALQDRQAAISAISSGNISQAIQLGSKALTEAQQGIQADDQSHHFAQSAMAGTDTGSNSGTYNAAKYNAMGMGDLNTMASTSANNWAQVHSDLQQVGISMDENHQYMKTPNGTLPVNVSPDQLVAEMTKYAGIMGFLVKGEIEKGVKAGIATSQAIAAKAGQDVQAKMDAVDRNPPAINNDPGKSGANAANAQTIANANAAAKNAQNEKDAYDAARKSELDALNRPKTIDDIDSQGIDWDERAALMTAHREALAEELGFEPIWGPRDNIFEKVHKHYAAYDRANLFMDEIPRVASNPTH